MPYSWIVHLTRRSREPSCIPHKHLRRLMFKGKNVRTILWIHMRKYVQKSSELHDCTRRSCALHSRLTYEGNVNYLQCAKLARSKSKGQKKYIFRGQQTNNKYTAASKNSLHRFRHKKRMFASEIQGHISPNMWRDYQSNDFSESKQCPAISMTTIFNAMQCSAVQCRITLHGEVPIWTSYGELVITRAVRHRVLKWARFVSQIITRPRLKAGRVLKCRPFFFFSCYDFAL